MINVIKKLPINPSARVAYTFTGSSTSVGSSAGVSPWSGVSTGEGAPVPVGDFQLDNNRVRIPVTGLYNLSAFIITTEGGEVSLGSRPRVSLRKASSSTTSSTTFIRNTDAPPANARDFSLSFGDVYLQAGDWIFLENNGVSWTVSNNAANRFNITRRSDHSHASPTNFALATDKQAGLVSSEDEIEFSLVGGTSDYTGSSSVFLYRVGKQVTVFSNGNLTHSSNNSPNSGNIVLPARFRPKQAAHTVYISGGADIGHILVNTAGQISTVYRTYSGSDSNRINSLTIPLITYIAAD